MLGPKLSGVNKMGPRNEKYGGYLGAGKSRISYLNNVWSTLNIL